MLELCDISDFFFITMTIIFHVVISKGICEDVKFLVFAFSNSLNLQGKYLTDEERKEMLSQGSKMETDCEMSSMVR